MLRRRVWVLILISAMLMLSAAAFADGDSAFSFDSSTGTITKYNGTDTDIKLPEQIDGVSVKAIGKSAFAKKNLTSLVLNEGLEVIGEGAFTGNSKLAEITFSSTIRRIEKMAFAGVSAEKIVLNDGLKYIGDGAFRAAKKLNTVNFPQSLEEIGNLVFQSTALQGDFEFGPNFGHIGHRVFDPKANILLSVGDSGNKIYLHDDLFANAQSKLNIPQTRELMVFARAFTAPGDIVLDAGKLEIAPNLSKDEIEREIKKAVLLTSGAAATKKSDSARFNDIYIESEIDWDLDNFVWNGDSALVKGSFNELNFGDDDSIYEGYTKPDKQITDAAMKKLLPQITLIRKSGEAEAFEQTDFTYGVGQSKLVSNDFYFGIMGLSESGKEKVKTNKHLVFPSVIETEEDGKTVRKQITGIGENAFKDLGLESITLPQLNGYKEFVIDTNAFSNNKLTKLILPEGVKVIESFAFKDNKIEALYLPETVLKVGSEAFKNNQISDLQISDDVKLIQLDNWSFADNKIKSVDMPYSIFKTLQYVFMNNPGMKKINDRYGLVELYTRNQEHLKTTTYIKNGEGQKFILVGEDAAAERAALYSLFQNIKKQVKEDYKSDSWAALTEAYTKAKAVFKDNNASKTALQAELAALTSAYDELESVGVNKRFLIEKINEVKNINSELYSESSYNDLMRAAKNAERVVANKEATQKDVDQSLKELILYLSKLALKEAYMWQATDFTYSGTVITGYSANGLEKFRFNKNLVIPDKNTEGNPITKIGSEAFKTEEGVILLTDSVKSPNGLQSVTMPHTITEIGDRAFQYNALKSIELHEGIQSIGMMAFNGNLLETVSFPESLTKLGIAAFSINRLTNIHFNSTLSEIPSGTFSMNITLKKVNFPDNIKKIGGGAFVGARLTSLDFNLIEKIDARAFQANQIEKLEIPGSIKVIQASVFEQNPKWRRLKVLKLNEGIEEIKANVFKSCLLKEVYLPYSLKSLDVRAFNDNMDENKQIIKVKLLTNNPEHLKFKISENHTIEFVEVNRKNLETLIKECDIIKETDRYIYDVADKKRAFNAALEKAKKSLAEAKSQVEIDGAHTALLQAQTALNGVKPMPKDDSQAKFENIPSSDYMTWNGGNGETIPDMTTPKNKRKINVVSILPELEKAEFTDLHEAKSAEGMKALVDLSRRGIIKGVSKSKIEPGTPITRAMFLTVLSRISQDTVITQGEESTFSDVPKGTWHFDVVGWAAKNKIANGNGAGQFLPDRTVNLQEFATFLHRYLNFYDVKLMSRYNYSLSDVSDADAWAQNAVLELMNAGIIIPDIQGKLKFSEDLTREETAVFLNRLIMLLINGAGNNPAKNAA